jgi:hypothetical protein
MEHRLRKSFKNLGPVKRYESDLGKILAEMTNKHFLTCFQAFYIKKIFHPQFYLKTDIP